MAFRLRKPKIEPEPESIPEVIAPVPEIAPIVHSGPNLGPGETAAEFKKRHEDEWKRPKN